MQIRVCVDQAAWDQWLSTDAEITSFTQAWGWGDILRTEGKSVERLWVEEGGEILAAAQVVTMPLVLGWTYVFCPMGPVVAQGTSLSEAIMSKLNEYLSSQGHIFLRFEPYRLTEDKRQGLVPIATGNPSTTGVLDLSVNEDQLLSRMHQKARYNIRLAEKKGLRVVHEKNEEVFMRLMEETSKRDGFFIHDRSHYRAILQSSFSEQLIVYLGSIPVVTAVFIGFGTTFTYLYGASSYAHRQLMGPYLMQWAGMRLGKERGYRTYDFFGIAPPLSVEPNAPYEFDPAHKYAGITRFKLGLGCGPFTRAGTWDLLFNSRKYRIYQLLRKLRRAIRI